MELPDVDNYDMCLIFALLDVVAQYSKDPKDACAAVYYKALVSNAFLSGTFVEPEPDDHSPSILEQVLEFGRERALLSLIVKSASFIDLIECGTSAYFSLEALLSLAREKLVRESEKAGIE